MEKCSECDYTADIELLETVKDRINHIYLDLKCGIPKIRNQYNIDDVMFELNELVENRP